MHRNLSAAATSISIGQRGGMTSLRRWFFLAGFCLFLLAAPAGPSAATAARWSDPGWVWPLEPTPTVVRAFDPPQGPYASGHRGVDLSGSAAQPVLAIGAGVVTFARPIAGRGVVVVQHGELRSTYEPVTATVATGQMVGPGDVLGLLQTTLSHCLPAACLHLGLRRGDVYLDPLSVLGPQLVRLKPLWAAGDGTEPPPVSSRQPDGLRAPAPPVAPGGRPVRANDPPAVAALMSRAVASLVGGLVMPAHARG